MKTFNRSVLFLVLVLSSFVMHAQSKTTTIIIVRHAEKEAVAAGSSMQSDPPLSAEGRARAENLLTALKDFTPGVLYSSNYDRTRSTLAPLSKKFGVEVQFYDPRNQQALVDILKTLEGQTIVVAGHSNTVPKLANMLLGENKYEDLADTVYNKIFIVRITGGAATVEVKEY